MKITVITLTRDEERIIPFFLRHYAEFADEIIVFDHHSTDGTRQIVESHPKARCQLYSTGGVLRDDIHAIMKSLCYQNKGPFPPDPPVDGDWFIVLDCDEFIWHPDLRGYLAGCIADGITLPLVDGYEMVGTNGMPEDDGKTQLRDIEKFGVPFKNQCKRAVIHKDCQVNFRPGAHECDPAGRYKPSPAAEIKLLHYKWLSLEHILAKMEWGRSTHSEENKKHGWGFHVYDLAWVPGCYHGWVKSRQQVVP